MRDYTHVCYTRQVLTASTGEPDIACVYAVAIYDLFDYTILALKMCVVTVELPYRNLQQ